MVLQVQSKRIVVLRRPILQIFCGFFQACKTQRRTKGILVVLKLVRTTKLQMLLPAGNPQRKAKILWKEELQAQNSSLKELGNVCICVYVPFRLKAPVMSKIL
jgi:hypothetical protein